MLKKKRNFADQRNTFIPAEGNDFIFQKQELAMDAMFFARSDKTQENNCREDHNHHLYTNYNSFVLLDSGKMICQVSANEKNSNWATSFRWDNQYVNC